MAVTIALSLNACTFTGQSETSNMVDESVSVDQGGQVIRVDIPNGDGTFTTLEGEEAQKWYDKAGEEDQQEAAKGPRPAHIPPPVYSVREGSLACPCTQDMCEYSAPRQRQWDRNRKSWSWWPVPHGPPTAHEYVNADY